MCKRFSDTYSQLKRFQLNDYRPNGHQNGTQQPATIEINPCILLHQQKENANVRVCGLTPCGMAINIPNPNGVILPNINPNKVCPQFTFMLFCII